MTPLMILQDIVKIAQIIHQKIKLTQSNQEKLKTLVGLMQRVVRSLEGLEELPNTEHFKGHLFALKECLQATSDFTASLSKKGKMEQFAFAGKYERKIHEFKNLLELE